VSLLAAYRQQLAEEAAGRTARFAKILTWFKLLWLGSILLGLGVAAWGGLSGGKWGFVFGGAYGLFIMLFGGGLYGLAQLFLSVKVERNG
jgi:hypothetical protein